MAVINGISIKGIKDFQGHEGEPLCQGNLYLNNKKIGFWSQDSWGGPDNIILDPKYSVQQLNAAIKALNPDKSLTVGPEDDPFVMDYDMERLAADFIDLNYDEKVYKNAVKKGYSAIAIASDGYNQVVWSLPKQYVEMSNDKVMIELAEELAKVKATFIKESAYCTHTFKVYRSPEDFIIGEPIKMGDITRKQGLDNMISFADAAAKQGGKKNKEPEPER